MPLSKERIKNKIILAFSEGEENESPEQARDRIADKLAEAIVDEIKELTIAYTAGLTAPNGPVTGQFNHTVS